MSATAGGPGGGELPEAYVAEKARAAIASEAHALGIDVTFTAGEFLLEGMVETAEQRARVERAARSVLGDRQVRNRLVIARPEAEVEPEELP
jgi:osmotically-inducible protein OsmY